MKTAIFVVTCALVGIVLGVGLSRLEMGNAAAFVVPRPGELERSGTATPLKQPPQVTVDDEDYEFGSMERGTRKSHEFIFTNTGGSPLELSVGDTTCKCTLGKTPDRPIPPGESVPVKLEWTANTGESQFRQSATIHTNDPLRPTVNLSVVGRITEASSYHPTTLSFGDIPSGTSESAYLRVVSFKDPDFDVLGYDFVAPAQAEHFEVEIEELPQSEYPSPDVQSGRRITVTAKPSLPFGRIAGWLKIRTSLATSSEIEVPLTGKVVSDISVFGPNYDSKRDRLNLGAVVGSEGAERRLLVFLRGERAADVELAIDEVVPQFLEAEFGDYKQIHDNVVQVPLFIRVPKGAPPAVYVGGPDSEPGRVVLRTTHPQVPEFPIELRFTVE